MNRIIPLIALYCLVVPSITAKDITVPRSENPPVIDGIFSDECWKSCEWQDGFSILANRKPEKEKTRFKIIAGKKGLYFAIQCADTKLKTRKRQTDSTIWYDDCIDIFLVPAAEIDPDKNVQEFYHFMVNASGSKLDEHAKGGIENRKWDAPWQAVSCTTDQGWQTEIFIPYAVFPNPSGQIWRMNIGRENPGIGNSSWNAMNNFKELEKFGRLKGLEIETERYEIAVTELRFDIQPEKKEPVLSIGIKSRPGRTLTLLNKISRDGKTVSFDSGNVTADQNGHGYSAHSAKISQSGTYTVSVMISDQDGIIAHYKKNLSLDFSPFTLQMKTSYRPEFILSRQQDKTVRFICQLQLPTKELQQSSIEVSAVDSKGKTVYSEKRKELRTIEEFSFDAAKLPYGKYHICVSLQNGSKIYKKTKDLTVAEPYPLEVWLNEKKQLVVNGKTTFPIGFMGCEDLGIFKATGCNMAHSYTLNYKAAGEVLDYLDQAEKLGIRVIMYPFPGGLPRYMTAKPAISEKQWTQIHNYVTKISKHPAFLAWYAYDEPRNPSWTAELKMLYRKLPEWDPAHPVIGCDDTPSGCIALAEDTADIIALDYYPNPKRKTGVSEKPVANIFNGLRKMSQMIKGKSIWNIPQAFSHEEWNESEYRSPTFMEIRCFTYSAIVAGVTGIMPYKIGSNGKKKRGIFISPDMRIGYLEGICPELAALSEVLLADGTPEISVDNPNIKIMVKNWKGKTFLFAVNPSMKNQGKVTFRTKSSLSRWNVLSENRSVSLSDGIFTDDFDIDAVHIYTDDPDFHTGIRLNGVLLKIEQEKKQ